MKIFLKSDLFNYNEEEFVSSGGSGEGVLVQILCFRGLSQAHTEHVGHRLGFYSVIYIHVYM